MVAGTDNEGGRISSTPARRQERSSRALLQTASLVGVLVLVVVLLKLLGGFTSTQPVAAPATQPPHTPASPSTPSATVAPTPTVVVPPTPTIVVPPAPVVPKLADVDRRQKLKGRERLTKAEQTPISFVVGAYNVLGATHTQGKKGRKGYAGADRRMPAQFRLLEDHNITVAGVQEFQRGQAGHFDSLGGGRWAQYPGVDAGLAVENSVIWRDDIWERVDEQLTPVPYFGGTPRDMPVVLLEHRESGRRIWFGSFHNPADVHGKAGHLRARAVEIEAALANDLRQPTSDDDEPTANATSKNRVVRTSTPTPVVFTGDMNDREAFICPFSDRTGMHSPDGAGQSDGNGCRTVDRMSVDWIVGTDDIVFNGYQQDWSSKDRRLSDHPVIVAEATLEGRGQEKGCVDRKSRAGTFRYCPVIKN